MSNQLLTVKEYAESIGISTQAVYKKLNQPDNPLNRYTKKVKNKLYIRREALNNIKSEEGEENPEETTNAETHTETENAHLRMIALLEKQIQEKDDLIKNLLQKIDDMTTLINQQQQLTLHQTKQLAERKKRKFLFFKTKDEE